MTETKLKNVTDVDEQDASIAERSFLQRLYTGSGGIDIVGKRRTW